MYIPQKSREICSKGTESNDPVDIFSNIADIKQPINNYISEVGVKFVINQHKFKLELNIM